MYPLIIRTVLLYLLIVAGLRIMGKRQIGELQPNELVVTILISNIATLPIQDVDVPLLGGVVPILTIVCFEVFLSGLSMKSHWTVSYTHLAALSSSLLQSFPRRT